MSIQLGNLELKDVVEEEYLEKVQLFLDKNGYKREVVCDNIEKETGNYHIFDIPRLILVCGEEKMQALIQFLRENDLIGNGFKGQLGLSYVDKTSK